MLLFLYFLYCNTVILLRFNYQIKASKVPVLVSRRVRLQGKPKNRHLTCEQRVLVIQASLRGTELKPTFSQLDEGCNLVYSRTPAFHSQCISPHFTLMAYRIDDSIRAES